MTSLLGNVTPRKLAALAAACTLALSASAQTQVVRNNTANNLNTDAAWTLGTQPSGTTIATWNGTSVGGSQTLGGNVNWAGIFVSGGTPSSGPTFTNGSPVTVTLGASGINLNGGTLTNRGVTFNTSANVELGANQTWAVGNVSTTTVGIIVNSIISGSSSLNVTRSSGSSGLLTLAGANTFSGGLTLGANTRTSIGAASVVSGSTITSSPLGTGTVTFGDGAVIYSSSGRDLASTGFTLNGNLTIGEASAAGRLRFNGAIDLANGTRLVTIANGTATGTSGNAKFGFVTIAGSTIANSVSNGTLSLQSSATGGNKSWVHFANQVNFVDNAGLTIGNNVSTVIGTGTAFGNNAASSIPNLTIEAGGTLDLSDQGTGNRAISVASLAGAGSVTNGVTNTNLSTLTINGTSGTATNNTVFSGTIANGATGGVALTKSGSTTQILTGGNTYTGTTTISGGTLQLGNGGTTGSLSASSPIVNNALLALNRTDTVTQGTDFASAISGSGGLTQAGSGNLILAAGNTYTGATTVSAGTLSLGATNSLADTSNVILSGGTLATNSFADTVGTLSLLGNATIDFTSGGSFAFANSAAATWTGGMTLSLTSGFVSGSSLRFGLDATGLTGTQLGQISAAGFDSFSLNSSGFLVGAAAIPEPSTYAALAGLAALGLAVMRRRFAVQKNINR